MTERDAPYRTPEKPPGYPPYVSSGRTPIAGLVGGIAAGTGVALVLSVIYAYGTLYIPIVQVEFLLTLGFGAGVGAATAGVMHRFHVRSRAIVIASTFALGVLAWACSWLPWLYGTLSRYGAEVSLTQLVDVDFVLGAIAMIYENGTWSIGSSSTTAVSGPLLGFVWLAEAAAIIGLSTFVGMNTSKDLVFCEACDSWCTVVADRARWDLQHASALRAAIVDRADLDVLANTPAAVAPDRWLALKLGFCTGCGETCVLAIDNVQRKVDNKGNASHHTAPFLPYRLIPRGEMRGLRDTYRC